MDFNNLIDYDFEVSVIGKYLSIGEDNNETAELDTLVSADDFYHRDTKAIMRVIEKQKQAGEKFDIFTMVDFDGEIDFGLANKAVKDCYASLSIIKDHAVKISELAKQRAAYVLVKDLDKVIGGKLDHEDKMTSLSDSLNKIAIMMNSGSQKEKTITTAMEKVIAYCDDRASGRIENGIKTGIAAIDKAMGDRGIGKTDFIVLGARPKTGKTLVSLAVSANLAMEGKKVLFFSLEMSEFELGVRLMANASYMKPSDIYSYVGHDNDEFWSNVSTASHRLMDKDLYIEDTPALKIQQIKAIAKQFSAKLGGLDLIVVDYLQKAGVNDKGRHDLAVGEISSGLKDLAKEIECPVFALSQLNRNGKGKPDMTHLRESGQIEQDADAIFLIHNVVDSENDEELHKHPIVEVNMPAYRHGQSAGPFYLTKKFGKIRDADQKDVAAAKSVGQQEAKPNQRPAGFKASGGFAPQ
ncbi:DnaB-like helicase C-terminal domain-containing protein [Pseudoalteromonas sp.]|uniref:DnaB-like helicase C-terminal domain-containing protein n=1 Tax=Pseudoalteromonas sp. TaxID=53249 RepID=UPI003D12D884